MMTSLRLLTVLLLAPSAAAQVVERAEVTSSGAPFYGQRVVGTGDVDGDGVPDLAVLDPTDGAGPLGTSSGRVFVISGATRATLHDVGVTGAMEWFQDLALVGDVDGDGVADLVIGVRGSLGTTGPGRARTISGATGGLLHEITGDQADDGLGRSVAGVGDLDGDGWPDVAVGAPSDRSGLSVTGSVRLCSGLDGAQLDIVFGPDADGAFGLSGTGPQRGTARRGRRQLRERPSAVQGKGALARAGAPASSPLEMPGREGRDADPRDQEQGARIRGRGQLLSRESLRRSRVSRRRVVVRRQSRP